jgi:hypothetical protein
MAGNTFDQTRQTYRGVQRFCPAKPSGDVSSCTRRFAKAREGSFRDYAEMFTRALQTLKDEGCYRLFADIRRDCGS